MAQQFYLLLGHCEGASQSLRHFWTQKMSHGEGLKLLNSIKMKINIFVGLKKLKG